MSTPEELDPSQNRVEEFCVGRLLRHLPANIRPLLLADRGFGRASPIHFLQQMPRHTGYPVDYVVRLKGDVVVQSADYRGRLRDYRLPKGRIRFWPQTLYRSDGAAVINLVLYWARGHREPWYLATSLTNPHQAVRMYRKRMQPEQYFKDGEQRFGLNRSTVTTTERLQSASGGLVGLLLACCLLILVGKRVSPTFRRRVCSRGKLGVLNLGYEYYLATPCPASTIPAEMTDTVITYTFRSLCAYCDAVVREDVEYSGPYDSEGHVVFIGGVECHACCLVVCAGCLPRLGRCRVRNGCPIRPPF